MTKFYIYPHTHFLNLHKIYGIDLTYIVLTILYIAGLTVSYIIKDAGLALAVCVLPILAIRITIAAYLFATGHDILSEVSNGQQSSKSNFINHFMLFTVHNTSQVFALLMALCVGCILFIVVSFTYLIVNSWYIATVLGVCAIICACLRIRRKRILRDLHVMNDIADN